MQPEVEAAIGSRRSIRGFTDQAVPRETVEKILAVSSRAPSMTNTQPWRVHVLTGPARARMCAEILAAHEAGEQRTIEYDYYPKSWKSPYIERRRQIGWALYGLLGIGKGDRQATAEQAGRNYNFFGAPVGMIFTIDRELGLGSWLDIGMFLENIMIAARASGLETCAQAAFANYHEIIRKHLPIPANELVVCGLALGHADPTEKANALVSPREPVAAFAEFHDV
jgi:nitroreductase